MRPDIVVSSETIERQRRAADPTVSAWVSANAGAGKTKVLTDRVVRLLLHGVAPARILCLTFTKAAAANMTIRVFDQLGTWVTLDDAALAAAITAIEGQPPDAEQLRRARCLFARAVETPGGLKIETIHAFCERLLHLAPFEANVPARFAVLDEAQSAELMAQARDRVLAAAAQGDPRLQPLAEAVEVATRQVGSVSLFAAIAAAARDERVPAEAAALEVAAARLAAVLRLTPSDTPVAIETEILEAGLSAAEKARIRDILLARGSANDRKRGEALQAALAAADPQERLSAYRQLFFTTTGEPRTDLVTSRIDAATADLLRRERDRVATLERKLKSALTLERTQALWRLAGAVRREIEAGKRRLCALDFDDLIASTLRLLQRETAAWVLYKLDRGIDHILIDEAQDTNPAQWKILLRLAEDFTSGKGAGEGRLRTFFAVGDPKQSIYGFQGAEPRWFDDSRRHIRRRSVAAELRFEEVRLDLSFRSAEAVLQAVDITFRNPRHFEGLAFGDGDVGTAHVSARPSAPGIVELWPVERKAETGSEPEAWKLPVDVPDASAPAVRTAERVAAAVAVWTRQGDEFGRVWRPKDVLILVRKRGPAFFAVIRALRARAIPVAGADRFDIAEHIAVEDLVAAGSAALLPQDDLALAAALKSPLVGLDDDDLIRIAAERPAWQSLAQALEGAAAAGDAAARRGWRALCGWRELARRNGPFGFYATLLGPEGGRANLVARLGGEAADAVDAFLCAAHTSELGVEAASLTTFLARFRAAEHPIRRDLEAAGDEVRVMTVHGAKGLEAPIVVVLDGCETRGTDPPLLEVAAGPEGQALPVWAPAGKHDCEATKAAREVAAQRAREEHHRLLYVAMTRAADRLVIAPFSSLDPKAEAWCEMVRCSLIAEARGLASREAAYGPIAVWCNEGEGAAKPGPKAVSALAPVPEPPWLRLPVAPEATAAVLSPSRAIAPSPPQGAARPAGGGRPGLGARQRGQLVHALLEHLPPVAPADRRTRAERFLAARAPRLGAAERDGLVAAALAVLAHPDLSALFGPGSRAEAAIAGRVRIGERCVAVTGQIDRVAVRDGEVLIADFKTAPPPPPGEAASLAHLGQLALYRALVAELYPAHRLRAFLVWTAGPEIREIAAAALDQALAVMAGAPT